MVNRGVVGTLDKETLAFNAIGRAGEATAVTVRGTGHAWQAIRASGAESGTSALFDMNLAVIEFWRSPEYGIEPGQNSQGFFQSMPLEGKPDPEQVKVAQVMKAISPATGQAQPGPAATPPRPQPATPAGTRQVKIRV